MDLAGEAHLTLVFYKQVTWGAVWGALNLGVVQL